MKEVLILRESERAKIVRSDEDKKTYNYLLKRFLEAESYFNYQQSLMDRGINIDKEKHSKAEKMLEDILHNISKMCIKLQLQEGEKEVLEGFKI